MPADWIGPDANDDDRRRVAKYEYDEEGLAMFRIEDAYLEPPAEYRRSFVARGAVPVEGVPERFDVKDVFDVVPSEDGAFLVSDDTGTFRDGSFTEDSPVVGLRYDPDFHERFETISRRAGERLAETLDQTDDSDTYAIRFDES